MANLKTHQEKAALVVGFFADSILNQGQMESIRNELYVVADKFAGGNIVVDLKNVKLLSSAMIGVLIRFKMRVRKNDGELKICNASTDLMNLLKVARLDKVFDIHATRRDAISAFSQLAK